MSEQTASSYPLEDGDGNIIYPPTLTSVVFDENSKRLDTVLANIPRLGKIDPEPVDTIPRDADTLGGHAPDYFATNDSLTPKMTDILAQVRASYTSIPETDASGNANYFYYVKMGKLVNVQYRISTSSAIVSGSVANILPVPMGSKEVSGALSSYSDASFEGNVTNSYGSLYIRCTTSSNKMVRGSFSYFTN